MSGSQDLQRPLHFRQISNFLLPQTKHEAGKNGAVSPALPNENTPLIPPPAINIQDFSTTTASDSIENRSLSNPTAQATLERPNITRAITVAATANAGTFISPISIQQDLRPELPRAVTSTGALTGRLHLSQDVRMGTSQPSFLSRASQAISNHLELGPNSHRNAPPAPSNWSDAQHRKYLVKLWDMVEEKAAKSTKYQVSTTAKVVSTEKSMLHNFPELGKGEVGLSREWVEYVLGVALRHPFCTAERMGRWEILASSSGARGTWGPW